MIRKKKNKKLNGFYMNDKTGHVSKPFWQKFNKVKSFGFTHNKDDEAPKKRMKYNINPNDKSDCYVKKNVEYQNYKDYKRKSKYDKYRIHKDDEALLEKIKRADNKKRRW